MDTRWLKMARPVAELRRGRTDWYRIENKAKDNGTTVAEVYIYDEIGYWGVTSSDFVRDFDAITADEIHVRLNSPGGEVGDGLAIYEAVKRKASRTTCYVDGYALSAASFILQAAGKRVVSRSSLVMIHNASGLAVGTAADMRELADVLDKLTRSVADIYAQRTGTPLDGWLAAMDAETWYSSQEAVDAGLADEVAQDEQGGDDTAANSWDLSIYAKAPRPGNRTHARPAAVSTMNNRQVDDRSGASQVTIDTQAFHEALKEAFQ